MTTRNLSPLDLALAAARLDFVEGMRSYVAGLEERYGASVASLAIDIGGRLEAFEAAGLGGLDDLADAAARLATAKPVQPMARRVMMDVLEYRRALAKAADDQETARIEREAREEAMTSADWFLEGMRRSTAPGASPAADRAESTSRMTGPEAAVLGVVALVLIILGMLATVAIVAIA